MEGIFKMFKAKRTLAAAAALLLTSLMPASADYVIRDGNNALQTIKAFNCLGVICPQMTPADGNGTAFGTSTNPFYVNTVNSAGFTAASTGTPISATTGGATGTLPAGAVVVATNVGATNGAYCALGAAATTASQYIAPNGGWFAFTVGVATQLTCATSTSTTTVNMTGGSGLATGTGGGGGGGSGGGGAIYGPTAAGSAAANPPVLMGGTVDGTATGNVDNWKVLAGIGYINCSNCSGSGISVPFAGSIGSNGTPGGFKDASSNFQPLLGDVTNGEWVSVKASVLPTGAATSALQTTGNTALGTINTTLGSPFQAGGALAANQSVNLTQIVGAAPSLTNPLWVFPATGATFPVSGTFYQATQPVSNAGTFAVQAAQATAANLNATVVGTGTFSVQLTGATNNINNVSGTISLPTGAATAALQTTGNTALGTINTTLGTPMQATGGSVTANAGTNLNTSLLALESGGNIASLVTQIGAVTASPTQYTIGDRLKTINTTIGTPMQASGGSVTANAGTNLNTSLLGTAANQATAITALGTINTTLNAPMQNSGGSVTANQSTAANLKSQVNIVSGGIASGGIAAGAQVDLLTMRGTVAAGTAAANSILGGLVYNSSPLTLTTTQQSSLQGDANGYLKVNVAAGGAGGGVAYGPTAAGSAAANPPVIIGGTIDGTATGNVDNWKVLAGIGYINCSNCSGSGVSAVDEAAFTWGTTPYAATGGFYQTTATSNALTNGQAGAWQFTAQRAGFVNLRDSSGNELGLTGAPVFVQSKSGAFPTGTFASGSIASGAVASGAVASGAYASGSIASGAMVDLVAAETPVAPNTATATKGLLAGGTYTSTQPTLTTTQQAALAFTARNAVIVAPGADSFAVQATLNAETSKVIGTVNQGTSPWIVAGGGTAGTPGTAVLTMQGISGGTAVPVSGTFYQTTQPVSIASAGIASGAIASGALASGSIAAGAVSAGAYVSGSVLSGAFASGSLAAGSMVDLLTMRGAVGAGAAPADALIGGAIYNSTPITVSNTQSAALQSDANGFLKVNVAAGSVTANAGTNLNTSLLALESGGNLATTATNTGTTATELGAVTASPTTYTIGDRLKTINTTLGSPFQAGGSIGNTSFAVTQGTAANLNATVVGTGTFAVQAAATLNATPSLANGNGVVPTQGGSVLSATNGLYANLMVGNAAVAVGTGAQGSTVPRVTVATDTATIAGSAPGTAGSPSTNVVTTQPPATGQVAVSTAPTTAGNTAQVVDLRPDSPGIVALGQATKANSVPVTFASDQDPCSYAQKSSVAIAITTATTTSLVPVSGSTAVYVCGFSFSASNVITTANILSFEYGTSTNCTGTHALTGGYGTGSVVAAAPTAYSAGNGSSTVFSAPASNGICAVTTIGATGSFEGVLTYVQQ
jgi:hypothetical protein